MKVYIPHWYYDKFWIEPPKGTIEFWAFKEKSDAEIGDPITFWHGKYLEAQAKIYLISAPGLLRPDDNRWLNHWKVFWLPESFVDLRVKLQNMHLLFIDQAKYYVVCPMCFSTYAGMQWSGSNVFGWKERSKQYLEQHQKYDGRCEFCDPIIGNGGWDLRGF